MEYYANVLCISSRELVEKGVMSSANYKQMAHRGRFDVVRRGGGSGVTALVAVDSLPMVYRDKVRRLYPHGSLEHLRAWVLDNYERDAGAVVFFHDRAKTGADLPVAAIEEYVVNASVLNTCIRLYERAATAQKLFGGKYDWERMTSVVEMLRDELGHTLPLSVQRFKQKVKDYQRHGYGVLISRKYGNQNTRKVTYQIERLILGLACLPNKPWNTTTHENYLAFVRGELDVYDPKTGVLMDPDAFKDEKTGLPIEVSESTIVNYLNKPSNRAFVEAKLMSATTFMHEMRPHVHRHGGDYSLSQVTMDDVDLTRKLKDTKQRVHAYYAYDVVSQCVIGAAYARKKDERLVVECFRDMFRFIEKQGWGMPAGIEVENHLMSQYKDGFLRAGVAFPFVRFCAPLNSQEKYAEPLNGAKKRSVIHKNHEGIGRFYGKGKWRQEFKKVSDETNELWEDKEYFTIEQLIEDDRRDNDEWNHRLHPNQKKFPGMTRWDVLRERLNPSLKPLDRLTLARYIGERCETTIRRHSTVRANHADWWLSDPSVLARLKPNDMKVTACWLPEEDGSANEVYLLQDEKFIDCCEKVETYNRVMAEQTDADVATYVEQQKKLAKFDAWIRRNEVEDVGIMPSSSVEPLGVSDSSESDETALLTLPCVSSETSAAPEEERFVWKANPIEDI